MYRLLTTKRILTKPKRTGRRNAEQPVVIDLEEEECNKELLKGLVVFDVGVQTESFLFSNSCQGFELNAYGKILWTSYVSDFSTICVYLQGVQSG